jgi:hypothetical protein
MWALNLHWWPYLAAALCAIAFVLALRGRLSEPCIMHGVVAVLILEGFLVFMTLVAFVLPFISFP